MQNHLIETASTSTGSLLIWDTGEYTILPYHSDQNIQTDTEPSCSSSSEETHQPPTTSDESSKLHQAFKNVRLDSTILAFFHLTINTTHSLKSGKSASVSTAPVYPQITPSPSASSRSITAIRNLHRQRAGSGGEMIPAGEIIILKGQIHLAHLMSKASS
ncbi:hypothetical protein XANCAGTX0491_000133 [Xanthoria calcicola]